MVTTGPNYAPIDQWEFRGEQAELGEAIKLMVQQIECHDRRWDRRTEHRQAFPCMFELTPLDPDDFSSIGDATPVIGKDISPGGVHFYHQKTLPYQYMLMSMIGPTALERGTTPKLIVKLRWCRFLRPGWYDSGGQFVRIATQPSDSTQADPCHRLPKD